jgi:hypothetical protein
MQSQARKLNREAVPRFSVYLRFPRSKSSQYRCVVLARRSAAFKALSGPHPTIGHWDGISRSVLRAARVCFSFPALHVVANRLDLTAVRGCSISRLGRLPIPAPQSPPSGHLRVNQPPDFSRLVEGTCLCGYDPPCRIPC